MTLGDGPRRSIDLKRVAEMWLSSFALHAQDSPATRTLGASAATVSAIMLACWDFTLLACFVSSILEQMSYPLGRAVSY
jgi:hypothetical protein